MLPYNKEKMMKKLIIPLSLLLLVACGQKSQKAPKAEEALAVEETQKEKPKGPLAQIEFPEGTEYDFGTYSEREIKSHDFFVRNPGKVPLVISQIETACSCTKATGPTKPILEGLTDTIHVIYNGNGFSEGFWAKHIRIHANIEKQYIDLVIQGSYIENK